MISLLCQFVTLSITLLYLIADVSNEEVGPKEDEDGVLVLTQSSFGDFVQNTDTALVEFYAPWYVHCGVTTLLCVHARRWSTKWDNIQLHTEFPFRKCSEGCR